MTAKNIIKAIACCVFSQTALAAVYVGDGEAVSVNVADGQTETASGPVMETPSSKGLEKTGGGEYVRDALRRCGF